MVVTCDIEFDQNPFGVYYAGQLVSGTVTLKADKPKSVKAVLLKVIGYSTTNWSEKAFNKNTLFSGHEDYMATLTYLLGCDESTRNIIPAGTHQYTFACQLPYNCPTSFEGTHGYIRYMVRVVLIRPWKYDQAHIRGFTVLRTVDLNYESPQIKIPSNTSNYRTFGCGPCTTDPLKLELSLPQSGFAPGQTIPINLLVINNTNLGISRVEFSLVMQVRYFSALPVQQSRVERTAIAIEKGDSVLANCTRSLLGNLHIPSTPPSCHNACKFIQIAYQVEVEAKMKGMHPSQTISIPVTIGSIPIWKSTITRQPSLADSNHTAMNSKDNEHELTHKRPAISNPFTRSSPNAIYPDLPPPLYEACRHIERGHIKEGEIHTFGSNEFTPLYPVYALPMPGQELFEMTDSNSGGYVNESYIG